MIAASLTLFLEFFDRRHRQSQGLRKPAVEVEWNSQKKSVSVGILSLLQLKMVWFSFSKARELLKRRRYQAKFGVRC